MRRRRRWGLWALPVAVVLAALVGGPAIVAQQATPPPPDEDLVTELVAIEQDLVDIALMAEVSISDDETWGTVRGDFTGARIQLDDARSELTTLVERANRSATPVGNAVEVVASSYRTMLEAYSHLEAFEEAGLAVVGEAAPDIAPDEARGHAEIGLRLLLESLAGFHEGYGVLRDADAAAEHRALFEGRFAAVEEAARGDAHDARIALSFPATQTLVPVDRFEPETAGAEPAQSVRYTCVDRDAWLVERPVEPVPSLPVPEGEQAQLPFPDCPDLDDEHTAVIVPPG